MFKFFHQRNLPDGGRGSALLRIKVDFLERYQLARLTIPPFENLLRFFLLANPDFTQEEYVFVIQLHKCPRRATSPISLTKTSVNARNKNNLLQLLERAWMSFVHAGRDQEFRTSGWPAIFVGNWGYDKS